MEFHPIANLFPLIEGKELDELAKDIAARGLLEPILVYEGKIVDGRNRFRACQIADVEPSFEYWEKAENPLNYVISKNLHRRHLTSGQRAMIVLEARDMIQEMEEDARRRQEEGRQRGVAVVKGEEQPLQPRSGKDRREGETATRLGNLVGVGPTTINLAKRVMSELPEEAAAVKAGQQSLNQATKKLPRNPSSKPFKVKQQPSSTEQLLTDTNAAYAALRPQIPVGPERSEFEDHLARMAKRILDLDEYQRRKQLEERQRSPEYEGRRRRRRSTDEEE